MRGDMKMFSKDYVRGGKKKHFVKILELISIDKPLVFVE